MKHHCAEFEELVAGRAMPDGCPRCESLLALYEDFRSGRGAEIALQERNEAEALLSGVIASAVAGETAPVRRAPATVTRRRPFRRWALTAAAVVVGGVGLRLALDQGPPLPAVYRGEPESKRSVEVLDARLAGGAIEIRWRSNPLADRHTVVFFDAALDTLAVLGPFSGSPASVRLDEVAALSGLDEVLFRVFAHDGEDPAGSSPLSNLRLR